MARRSSNLCVYRCNRIVMIGKKILLRALEPTDIDTILLWENDQRLWHLSNTLAPFSRFTIEQYIQYAKEDLYTAKQLRLMIDDSSTGETVGCIDLFEFDPSNKRAGVGILIDESHREKGFASEALSMIIQYAFDQIQLHQLFCNIGKDNKASIQLFKQNGFVQIGVKKEWNLIHGEWEDEILFQLIKKHA